MLPASAKTTDADSVPHVLFLSTVAAVVLAAAATACGAKPAPPRLIGQGPKTRPVLLPDGSLRAYAARSGKLLSVTSRDGGRTWSRPKTEFDLPHRNMGGGLSLVDSDGEVHVVLTHPRGSGKPAATRFIDLWHVRTAGRRTRWGRPQRIWEGYCGAVMDVKQLHSGRLVVPFAAWKRPGESVAPSTGSNYTTAVVSDDGGTSWKLSPSKLTAPCRAGYNGNNYGAIEPTILQLKDGRVWMLMRTQTGFLYESFSRDGLNWSPAKASRFHSSTSPAALARLPDGRIVLVWNNCEQPPRHNNAGVYGGRDVLHAAISSDEGATWRGFREIYRDPHRNETPPRRGDRGTAYPQVALTRDGRLAVVSGQGNRRTLILLDPDWLMQTAQADAFDDGLAGWHVWKPFGPACGYWRDRTQGPVLLGHPAKPGKKVLHVRRPDKRDGDCATWNFPAGAKGTITLRFLAKGGFGGATIALNNRFFNPADDRAEQESPLMVRLGPGGLKPRPGTWQVLTLKWDFAKKQGAALLDGTPVAGRRIAKPPFGGFSYLRIRSAAKQVDPAGMLIESVSATVAR